MRVWTTIKGHWMLRYPNTVFVGKTNSWGFSHKRYSFLVSEDTTTPYSILHIGPFEFFIRPRHVMIF
jgi:hypothetical protein